MEFFLGNLLDSEKKSPWNEYVVRWNRRNKIEKTNGYTCIPKERKGTQTAYILKLLFYFNWNFLLFLLSFDLVAIGGISVVLIFDRSPFLPEKRTLWLPWNQFIVVEKVTMQRVMSDPPSCDISNFISPNPIVLPSPLTSFGGSCPERGTIVPELQVGTWTLKLQKS